MPWPSPAGADRGAAGNDHARGARLMSICSGVFVLAATGLLDGRRVTTHWRYAEMLRTRWPGLRFDPDVLYVDEGDISTSAGSAARTLILALHLVRTGLRAGDRQQSCAAPGPAGSSQWRAAAIYRAPGAGCARAARLSDLIARHARPFRAPVITDSRTRLQLAAMSERTFIRRFTETTGETPSAWLTTIRLDRARELLEESKLPIDEVARLSGFGSTPTLRHHFRRQAEGKVPATAKHALDVAAGVIDAIRNLPRNRAPGERRSDAATAVIGPRSWRSTAVQRQSSRIPCSRGRARYRPLSVPPASRTRSAMLHNPKPFCTRFQTSSTATRSRRP